MKRPFCLADENNLLLKAHEEGGFPIPMIFMVVHEGQPTTIPCRATHPDVAVSLWKSGQEVGSRL